MLRVLVRAFILVAGFGLLILWLDKIGYFKLHTAQNHAIQAEKTEKKLQNPYAGIILKKQDDGFFYVDAWVNDDPVHFLVDPGASAVILTRDTAYGLGFDLWDEEFDLDVKTADDDTVKAARITLDEVNINDEVIARHVTALVLKEGDTNLLGMSFLAKISGYSVEGDEMILRP